VGDLETRKKTIGHRMGRVHLKPVYQCRPEDLIAFPKLHTESVQDGMRGPYWADDEDRSKRGRKPSAATRDK
jgi:hypothetical protein